MTDADVPGQAGNGPERALAGRVLAHRSIRTRLASAERIAEAARPIAEWLWSVRQAGQSVGNLDMALVDALHAALEGKDG